MITCPTCHTTVDIPSENSFRSRRCPHCHFFYPLDVFERSANVEQRQHERTPAKTLELYFGYIYGDALCKDLSEQGLGVFLPKVDIEFELNQMLEFDLTRNGVPVLPKLKARVVRRGSVCFGCVFDEKTPGWQKRRLARLIAEEKTQTSYHAADSPSIAH